MPTRYVVDEHNQLLEAPVRELPPQPAGLVWPARIISVLFHPLFVPVYVIAFLVYIEPYLYNGFSRWDKTVVILQAVVMYSFFPLVTVLLLKAVRFIDSVFLHTQRDRVIPYVACGIWYFWAWYVRHNLPDTPNELIYFSLGIFLAGSAGLIANIFMKVSMHAMAMGVAAAFLVLLALHQDIRFTLYVSVAILATGLVCTGRLICSDHSPREIYTGLAIGVVSLLLGYLFT
ncbi:MAG TPA: phosphatase PAP2 family protein [Chitinophagaceae bacterium]|nr:phosphatase PAP2 family protein [Chitinophagaceae bacterium]